VCGVTGWFRRIVLIAGAVVVLGVAGCSGDGKGPVDPPVPSATSSAASVAPTASPTGTVDEQILAQYRRFWTEIYPAVLAAPSAERRSILEPVVDDPLMGELLRIARGYDHRNKRSSGTPVLIGPEVSLKGHQAVVAGCVDMTNVILRDRTTGKITDQGRLRIASETYFKDDRNGAWRAYALNEPRGKSC
jgi:hypothetical protein